MPPWDSAAHIKEVKTFLSPKHPFYPMGKFRFEMEKKPFLVGSYKVECDRIGRLLTLVNANGEKYVAGYFADGEDKKKGVKKFERAVLTDPAGAATYVADTWKTDQTKLVENGYVAQHESGRKIYEPRVTTLMAHKASSLVTVEQYGIRGTRKFKRENASLAITAETNPLGQTTRYRYNDIGLKTGVIYPDDTEIRYEYDAWGRVTAKTDELDRVTAYKYIPDGGVSEIDESGVVTRYLYDQKNRPVKTIMPDGTEHAFQWDDLLRLATHTRPDGVTVKYRYAAALPTVVSVETVSKDNKSGSRTVKYSHDHLGRVTRIDYPDSSREEFAYNCCDLIKAVARDGAVTQFAYDQNHNKVMEISPKGGKTKFEYDSRGRLIKTTYPDKLYEQYAYDKNDNQEYIRKTDGQIVKCDYDQSGRFMREMWRNGRYSAYSFDLCGRMLSLTGDKAKNTEYQYNLAGQVIAIIDYGLPRKKVGKVTTQDYDDHGRLSTIIFPDSSIQEFFYRPSTRELCGFRYNNELNFYFFDAAGRKTATAVIPWDLWQAAKTEADRRKLAESKIIEKNIYDDFGELVETQRVSENKVAVDRNDSAP